MFGFSRLPKLRRWSGWALSHRGTASAAASKSWMVPAAGVAALGVVGAAYAMSGEKSKVTSSSEKSGAIPRKRVAIYGGTFDPPTNSHMTCASEIVNSGCADEVWIVPCGPRPDKSLKASPMDRYCMCQIAVCSCFAPSFPVKVSDLEAYRETAFYTYDMLCQLKETYPDVDFAFVIGSDWLRPGSDPRTWVSLNKNWKPGMPEDQKVVATGEQLLSAFDVLVIPRPGYEKSSASENLSALGPRLQWLRMPEDFHLISGNLSSTEIRQRMLIGKLRDIEGLVPAGVLSYIRRSQIY